MFRGRRRFQGTEELCPLTDLAEGERGVVVKAQGGFGLVRRLAEMGLTPGTEVKLLKKGSFGGPVEVEVRGVALALGHGVASKVLVKPLKDEIHG
ncbi:MAG: FeoA family protein [Candidatus Bathyarchaeia archaeon]